MEYRRIGRSGLKVSVLSFGSWVSFGPQLAGNTAESCLAAAYDAGVNFFDNAEAYSAGESERIMGESIARLGWPRYSYVISTKLFWGLHEGVNMRNTLNRKYLMQGIDASLKRLGLDFVDILYCHRPDPETPIEETVFAMNDIITSGKALYWGTSEFSAAELIEVFEVAERHHLRAPIVEQPQYHLLERQKVEVEFAPLYERFGIGLTTWSPLASGLLTGKYRDGVPANSRGSLPGYEWLRGQLVDPAMNAKVPALAVIADDLGCSLAQLAIAWCARNEHVSSVILGVSRLEQLQENLGALEVIDRLDKDTLGRIDVALGVGAAPR
jgi:voltage-dependent potassium channel beta subunit